MPRLASPDRIRRAVAASRPVREGCHEVAVELERTARALAAVRAFDSGDYLYGIGVVPTVGPGALVRSADGKSWWIERGTGIYGPRRTPIVPKKPGGVLVFRVTGGAPLASMSGTRTSSGLIFAKSVKGRPASHVMEDAAKAVAAVPGRRWRPGPALA